MKIISANDPILKIESLQTKFDLSVVSNSLVNLIGSYLEARIVQQIHYWTVQEYGQEINGKRWIYKPIREWLCETIIGFTSWQLREAISSLVEKGIILRKHLFKEHHGHNFSPKNRTYYYSLNYDSLEEFAQSKSTTEVKSASDTKADPLSIDNVHIARTIENVRFVSTTKQFCDSSKKQFCVEPKNNTKNTSIENISKDQSHPNLPCVSKSKLDENNQRGKLDSKESSSPCNSEILENKQNSSFDSKDIGLDINNGQVEEKINQNKSTNNNDIPVESAESKPKPKIPRGTKPNRKRRNDAPWKDQGQFKRFYRALIQALPIVANARSAQGLAQVIIKQLRAGIPHSYWDDFAAGLPIGTSTKPEWEVEPGVPYPMFIEYLTEKIIKGNNTQSPEQARNEVFRILSQPRQATAFWGQFKHSVVNVSEQVERDHALGVSNPNTPVWTRERVEPSIAEAAAAGDRIRLANGATEGVTAGAKNPQLEAEPESNSATVSSVSDPWNDTAPQLTLREMAAQRKIKGFAKAMPQVSPSEIEAEARQEIKPKTNINQMSLAEINEYLTDPVLKAQLAPQLMKSDYQLITDEIGRIISVKAPPSQLE